MVIVNYVQDKKKAYIWPELDIIISLEIIKNCKSKKNVYTL